MHWPCAEVLFYKDLWKTDIDVCQLAGAANGNGAAENEYEARAYTRPLFGST